MSEEFEGIPEHGTTGGPLPPCQPESPALAAEAVSPDEREERRVDLVNSLSDVAVHIAANQWFGRVVMGTPILFAPKNETQERAFAELLEAGLVHGDVERGVYGYRPTWEGRAIHPIALHAIGGGE